MHIWALAVSRTWTMGRHWLPSRISGTIRERQVLQIACPEEIAHAWTTSTPSKCSGTPSRCRRPSTAAARIREAARGLPRTTEASDWSCSGSGRACSARR
ncbi:MAG: hypothetical protein ACREH6_11725 [Geminicoccaceae bacterium]